MAPEPGGASKITARDTSDESDGEAERTPLEDGDGDVAILDPGNNDGQQETLEDSDIDAEGEEVYDEEDTIVAANVNNIGAGRDESTSDEEGEDVSGKVNGNPTKKAGSSAIKSSESGSSDEDSSSLDSGGENEWNNESETAEEVMAEAADSNRCMYAHIRSGPLLHKLTLR